MFAKKSSRDPQTPKKTIHIEGLDDLPNESMPQNSSYMLETTVFKANDESYS